MSDEKELRELDAWVAEHVMGCGHLDKTSKGSGQGARNDLRVPHYTTNPADALAVLKACAIKRTTEWDKYRPDATLVISAPRLEWDNKWIIMSDAEGTITAQGHTLEETICRFAKLLFSK